MNPEFFFKLGHLLGTLDDFLIRAEDGTVTEPDIDRMRCLAKDLKKRFFEAQKAALAEESL